MRLFNDYLQEIDSVLSKRSFLNYKHGGELPSLHEKNTLNGLPTEKSQPKTLIKYDKSIIEKYFGVNSHAFPVVSIGPHPDFKFIVTEHNHIKHYCVSVFIDIKGSTTLIKKYPLETVRLIKDTLLTLAIQVASQFGGHIHRLQGDGIFLQFVRINKHENDAIINALNASSILSQFVSVDLAEIFMQNSLDPLQIRIGIDFGDNDSVLWSYYGLNGCNELTTTSLHTDMAAKFQSIADDNSIIIGRNVKEKLDLTFNLCNFFDRDMASNNVISVLDYFDYCCFSFSWKSYLLTLPYYKKVNKKILLEDNEPQFKIECFISDHDDTNEEKYYPNSRSIPKGKKIKYLLKSHNSLYIKPNFQEIKWFAHNSGKEADNQNMLEHEFGEQYHNKTVCETTAAFLGHHYVECRISNAHSKEPIKITFPIFVQ